ESRHRAPYAGADVQMQRSAGDQPGCAISRKSAAVATTVSVSVPIWIEFEERPVPDFELRAPARELAAVLQRYRADLDAAARAGAEGRAQSLLALAEQAVLAIELEKQLVLRPAGPVPLAVDALRGLKDRML